MSKLGEGLASLYHLMACVFSQKGPTYQVMVIGILSQNCATYQVMVIGVFSQNYTTYQVVVIGVFSQNCAEERTMTQRC